MPRLVPRDGGRDKAVCREKTDRPGARFQPSVRSKGWPPGPTPANLGHDCVAEDPPGDRRRSGDPRVAVKPFRYWRDGLFLGACSLYALNRWVISSRVPNAFLRGQFNDLLLIPCALPLLLLLQRWLKLRLHDQPPQAGEIALHLVIWSFLFEVVGPHLVHQATGDLRDVAAYVAGGIFGWWWWNRGGVARGRRSHEF